MSTEVKHRRGTAAQHASFTGAEAEITYDSTNKALRVHDGVTAGGEIVSAPYLEQTAKALQLIPWSMRDDVLSGAMALDHTAALLSIFTDANLRRCLEFPAGGIFGISQLLIPPTTKAREIIMHGATIRGRAVKHAGNFVQFLAPGNAYGLWDDLKMEGGTIDQAAAQIGGKLFRTLFLRRASFSHMTVKHRTAVRRCH